MKEFLFGIREGFGFWSSFAILFSVLVYLAASLSNLTFEWIATALRKKRNVQREEELRCENTKLKAKLFDALVREAELEVRASIAEHEVAKARAHARAIAAPGEVKA